MSTGVVIVKEWERYGGAEMGRGMSGTDREGSICSYRHNSAATSWTCGEQVDRVPTQKYITRDNVVIDMDFVLYYRVVSDQAEKAVIGVTDHRVAVRNKPSRT